MWNIKCNRLYFGRQAVWGYFRSASHGIPDQSEKQEYRSKPLMDRERERERERKRGGIKYKTSSGLLPGAEVERNLFLRHVNFAPQLHPGPLSHIHTLVHPCGWLYHMWMKGNYFSRECWPWCRTRREKESHRTFIYLPCPAFLSHELKASLCPAPPSWRAFSFPAADEKRWHAFLPFPASLLLEGEGARRGVWRG